MRAAQVDAAAGRGDALVQLGVLVGGGAGIVESHSLEHGARKRAAEHGVHVAFGLGPPVARAADAQRAFERRAESMLKRSRGARARRPAHVVGAGAAQLRDALGDVVGRVVAVRVEADDHAAARDAQDLVHAPRLNAAGVVDDAYSAIVAGQGGEDLARPVAAAAVGDHDFEPVGGIVLREDVAHAALDERRLVEARDGDGDERCLFHGGRGVLFIICRAGSAGRPYFPFANLSPWLHPRPAVSFPVPLACPSCGAPLAPDAACGCPAATRMEMWNGMPRLLFGQAYRGEYSSGTMSLIVDRMDSIPWRRALEESGVERTDHELLTGSIGPDFIYGLPWDEIETALDVGSGMGHMAALLAERAKTVVALEPVPERALFQRKRAAQDGLSNWHPIIAGDAALPFAPGTFDLITLNGACGPAGALVGGDPETRQRRFLDDAFRLLKPGGYLYVGAANRLALAPARYKKLFSTAGFGSVEVFGVFDGFERQKAVYPLDDARPRRFARELANPAASWRGSLRRWLSNAGPWSGILEDGAVVVFGRKNHKDGRLAWPGLPHGGAVTQFSTGDKFFVVCYDEEPSSVFKGAKTSEAAVLLAKEYDFSWRRPAATAPRAKLGPCVGRNRWASWSSAAAGSSSTSFRAARVYPTR